MFIGSFRAELEPSYRCGCSAGHKTDDHGDPRGETLLSHYGARRSSRKMLKRLIPAQPPYTATLGETGTSNAIDNTTMHGNQLITSAESHRKQRLSSIRNVSCATPAMRQNQAQIGPLEMLLKSCNGTRSKMLTPDTKKTTAHPIAMAPLQNSAHQGSRR